MARLLGALLLCTALATGCGDRAGADVTAFAPELLAARGGGPWLEPQLRRAVEHARWLRAERADDVPALPLSIEIGELTGTSQTPVLRLVAQAQPPEAWRARLGDELEAIVEVEPRDGVLDPAEHGRLAVDRAVAVLDAKLGLELDGRSAIAAILSAEDAQIVVLGLDWVADRRGRAYADEVAALVDHPDERVSLRAVECLGIVGEARHAHALVRLPRLADRAYAQRIYDALARLGGDEAAGFLQFAVQNEDDPVMMEVAADALSRLESTQSTTEAGDGAAPRGHR